jgi:hypothetical protein
MDFNGKERKSKATRSVGGDKEPIKLNISLRLNLIIF